MKRIPAYNKVENKCCGCEGCASVCPVAAIQMLPDDEGFLYPYIDENKCTKCGLCTKICPQIKNNGMFAVDKKCAYGGYSNNSMIVEKSSSGGIFSCIVEAFLERFPNGYYVGVVWGNDFRYTKYYISNNINDLEIVRGSKYIQARKELVYKKVKALLDAGKSVLFSGCPCETMALMGVIGGRKYDNLYVIDLVCKGATSEKVLNEYLASVPFRNKKNLVGANMRVVGYDTWIPQWMKLEYSDNKVVYQPFYLSKFGIAFQILQRPACYSCKFCGTNRFSDITLGDYHGAEEGKEYYNSRGTSEIVVNTEKGDYIIEWITNAVTLVNVDYNEIARHNPRLKEAWNPDDRYERFRTVFAQKGLIAAWKAVTPWVRQKKNDIKEMIYYIKANYFWHDN